MRVQVPPLDSNKIAVGIVVGRLEPVVAVAVLPGGDAAPADDAGIEVALVKEEPAGFPGKVRTLEVAQVARGIEAVGLLLHGLRVGILGEDDVGIVGEPAAGIEEVLVQVVHHQVYRAAVGIAHVALVGVLAHVEVQAGVPVVVEGTEGHVAHGMEPEPSGNSLDGECTELGKLRISNF